jgi:predicted GNAT family acetyltransferase
MPTRSAEIFMSYDIQHDQSARRFETTVDGAHCLLDYTLADGVANCVMTMTHTEVPVEVGGRGVASALVQAALDAARKHGWKVIPACSYADAWMKRHAGYGDLRL